MLVLVTGASGVLGRRVVTQLLARGHQVRAATRAPEAKAALGEPIGLDLVTGEGLEAAVAGVDAIVHCATYPRQHRLVDAEGTRRLAAAASRSAPHLVLPGIVGSDVIPLRYYRSKLAAEEAVTGSGLPWTIGRATQFHQLIWHTFQRLARLPALPVPRDTRVQPIDPASLARRLVDAVEVGPQGRLPDIGGPYAYEARDLARSYLTAVGRRRGVVAVNLPGIVGAALRAGGNLTPNRDDLGETWNDYVRRRLS